MQTEQNQIHFMRCLDRILRDERGRAFIREKIKQNELPVIKLSQDRSAQTARTRRTNTV